MALLVCVTGRDNSKLIAGLRESLPDTDIREWPQTGDLAEIEFVLAWNAPESLWQQLPNLKVVQSFGAGVDGIPLAALPSGVQVCRIVDPALADDMAEYVLGHVLAHKLRLSLYYQQQQHQVWRPKRACSGRRVGILGLGQLGQVAATKLRQNGFEVLGWSRSEKKIPGINTFWGQAQLTRFASQCDYLICLLPLTAQTRGILDGSLFEAMPTQGVLINVARGAHLNEADLLHALDTEQIAAATLDVFASEPVEPEHAFWQHPKITMTPHVAALTSLRTAMAQIVSNMQAMQKGEPLSHCVDISLGY
ncbi:2-hydroxyacid dehydrogenase [Pseudoalteromonas ardens]|uniref:2-hydroxyacid dehydrogenase n=1 Tax=Pseudoalteromonas rubra TaxID=43658 RepID=A0A0L0EVT6_9GAMM|nr:glyoxylate/hydroxypyruvate reductase A [Pseudoalteromonas sp. R96]KNC67973.1 2-hydroxyacid dehydrogenase [Pseudoalteromonas rubra]MDK1311574.1 glyoxylate/hydroxypyruvate reductase A [Pseudoalteromonas sp. R96]